MVDPLTTQMLALGIPIAALGFNVCCQIALARLHGGLLRSLAQGFLLGLGLLAALEGLALSFASPWQGLLSAAPDLLSYVCLGYLYFHFVNLGETARRIRILREIASSGNGLTEQELLTRYDARTMVEKRLRRLLDTGQVELRGRRYYLLKKQMFFISKSLNLLKKFILGSYYSQP